MVGGDWGDDDNTGSTVAAIYAAATAIHIGTFVTEAAGGGGAYRYRAGICPRGGDDCFDKAIDVSSSASSSSALYFVLGCSGWQCIG